MIAACLQYCPRNIFASKHTTFNPNDNPSISAANQNIAFSNRPPSLGHLILVVRHLSDYILSCEDSRRETSEKLSSINVLSSAELSSYLPPNVADKLSSSDRRILAANKMRDDVARLDSDIKISGQSKYRFRPISFLEPRCSFLAKRRFRAQMQFLA